MAAILRQLVNQQNKASGSDVMPSPQDVFRSTATVVGGPATAPAPAPPKPAAPPTAPKPSGGEHGAATTVPTKPAVAPKPIGASAPPTAPKPTGPATAPTKPKHTTAAATVPGMPVQPTTGSYNALPEDLVNLFALSNVDLTDSVVKALKYERITGLDRLVLYNEAELNGLGIMGAEAKILLKNAERATAAATATAPVAKATAPVAKGTAPVAKGTAPVAKATAPVAKATAPVAKAKATEDQQTLAGLLESDNSAAAEEFLKLQNAGFVTEFLKVFKGYEFGRQSSASKILQSFQDKAAVAEKKAAAAADAAKKAAADAKASSKKVDKTTKDSAPTAAPENIICRHGNNCWKPDCVFSHPSPAARGSATNGATNGGRNQPPARQQATPHPHPGHARGKDHGDDHGGYEQGNGHRGSASAAPQQAPPHPGSTRGNGPRGGPGGNGPRGFAPRGCN